MSSPTSVKQVQSFVQTCSWYRRYIPNFSQIAKPLTDLTKKKAMWKWGSEQEEAFRDLKVKLASPPVLKPADGTKPFVIRTDARSGALGAVLLQGEKDEEHPIEYASRLLSSSERNYSTTEREALAIVWALEKLRGYVEGQTIRLSSDHQPLKWLLSLKSPTGRLARWALQIQSYNLTIDYIPGRSNFIADLLSRPTSEQEKADCDILAVFVDFPTRSPKEVRQKQLKDDELKKIIECFENNERSVNFAIWLERGYLMNQGILFRYSPTSESEEAQLVVPIHERQDILKIHHDAPNVGHYGSDGTFERISKRYYWTGMRSYITDYVKNCTECNRYKPSNQKPSGLLHTPVYSQRFETISIDLFGPLPES
ncbi:transposon Tf2-6 polyprotein [Trichonephila clavipes]|nr:transposon Tf2-6 polyprotein [Trichonephila clavipes]